MKFNVAVFRKAKKVIRLGWWCLEKNRQVVIMVGASPMVAVNLI